MENRYLKFKKLNWLLSDSFEAERVYYNASEDVQEVELKRFFNRQTVKRNRYSHEISEQLVQAGVEPIMKWAQKGNLNRTWRQEKKVLTKTRPLKLLRRCCERDEQNLILYNEILEERNLPKDILKMLKKQKAGIIQALSEAEQFRKGEKNLKPETEPKVRKLKAI